MQKMSGGGKSNYISGRKDDGCSFVTESNETMAGVEVRKASMLGCKIQEKKGKKGGRNRDAVVKRNNVGEFRGAIEEDEKIIEPTKSR